MDHPLAKFRISPPAMIVLATSLGVFLYLFFLQGYSTGYFFERESIWASMQRGYRQKDSEWGFGYAVVPAVLVLLWVTRDRYRGLEIKSGKTGLVLLLLAFFLYFGGYKANDKFFGYVAGQLFVAGVIIWFGGWAVFRRAFWLWVVFGLVWPLTFLINPISVPLQRLMAILTHGVLQLIEQDGVIRSGTVVMSAATPELGAGERFNLGISAPCSGLRSLFALSMVSLLYGYLSLEKGWQRFLLLCASLPFAIIGNFFRMMMLYVGTLTLGAEVAIGKGEKDPSAYHIGAGILVFIVALFCMMALVTVLKGGLKTLRRKKTRVRKIGSKPVESPTPDTP